jgi:hypothetical protein
MGSGKGVRKIIRKYIELARGAVPRPDELEGGDAAERIAGELEACDDASCIEIVYRLSGYVEIAADAGAEAAASS